jgi:hypothetical protein
MHRQAVGDACEGFFGDFMGAMDPTAFAGFTSGCIGGLRGAALSNWTSDQVK